MQTSIRLPASLGTATVARLLTSSASVATVRHCARARGAAQRGCPGGARVMVGYHLTLPNAAPAAQELGRPLARVCGGSQAGALGRCHERQASHEQRQQ